METTPERRQFLRFPIRVRVRLRLADDPGPIRSQTGDLSGGGLYFYWIRVLAKGSLFKVNLPVLDRAFNFTGRVVYSVKDALTGLFRTGVAFREPSSVFRKKLDEEILGIQKLRDKLSQKEGYPVSDDEAAAKWIQKYSREFAKIYK